MFENQFLLIFFVFFEGAFRCSHVAKLANGLMGRDQKLKCILSHKFLDFFFFHFFIFFWLILIYNVIFSMTI